MVTTPMATGGVGGRLRVRSVAQKKRAQANAKAAIQSSAEETCPGSERSRVMRAECTRAALPPKPSKLLGTALPGKSPATRRCSRESSRPAKAKLIADLSL